MKERRKRRSAKDIKESIINAATHLIETEGFSNLTVTGIMRQAEIEPVQFYNRYDDLNKFIDEYVKKYDYWFSDIVKSQKQSSNDKALYMNILVGLFQSLSENKIMQELLKWELANNNETSQRTAQLRELHTLPLCQKFSNIFSNTDIDIVTISALIIGGIYYPILHITLCGHNAINPIYTYVYTACHYQLIFVFMLYFLLQMQNIPNHLYYYIIFCYVDVFRCYWCVCTFQTWNFNK